MTITNLIKVLWGNSYYLTAMILFVIGFHTLMVNTNLIKKIMGLNIMETGIFLLLISTGYIRSGLVPIFSGNSPSDGSVYVNPLPSALILTGIVIAVSLTAFSLSLIIRLYEHYRTLNVDSIAQIRLTGRRGPTLGE